VKIKKSSKIKIIFGIFLIIVLISSLLYVLIRDYFNCEPNYKMFGIIETYEIMENNVTVDNPFAGKRFFDCKTECYEEYGTNSYKIKNHTLRVEKTNSSLFSEICYCDLNNCYLKNLFK